MAYCAVGDRELSKDLTQDTFLTAWRKLGDVRDDKKLAPWLCGIARNLARNASRRRKHQANDNELSALPESAPSPLQTAIARETEVTVWNALRDLPENLREPLVLYYQEGKSMDHVATALGLSEPAARKRLSRARKALRDNLAGVVESTLERARPGASLTAGIVASLPAFEGVSAGGLTEAATSSQTTAAAGKFGMWFKAAVAVAAVGAAGVGVALWSVGNDGDNTFDTSSAPALEANSQPGAEPGGDEANSDPANGSADRASAAIDSETPASASESMAGPADGQPAETRIAETKPSTDGGGAGYADQPLITGFLMIDAPVADVDRDGDLTEDEIDAYRLHMNDVLLEAIELAVKHDHRLVECNALALHERAPAQQTTTKYTASEHTEHYVVGDAPLASLLEEARQASRKKRVCKSITIDPRRRQWILPGISVRDAHGDIDPETYDVEALRQRTRGVRVGGWSRFEHESGLQRGDILVKVGDTLLDDISSLRAFMEEHPPGAPVEITVRRGGQLYRGRVPILDWSWSDRLSEDEHAAMIAQIQPLAPVRSTR